jgi:hypothetical protein
MPHRSSLGLAPWRWSFGAIAFAFVFTACFHLAAAVRADIDPEAPAWRHLLFVGINLACVAGVLYRPRVFIPPFLALTVQQIWTHGGHAVRLFETERVIDYPSIAVLIVMPTTLALLVRDVWSRARASG